MNINTNVYKQYVKSGSNTKKIPSYMFSAFEKPSAVKKDTFSISPQASLLKECSGIVRSAVNDISAPADEDRINSLRQQIESGSYNVPSESIADAILERIV